MPIKILFTLRLFGGVCGLPVVGAVIDVRYFIENFHNNILYCKKISLTLPHKHLVFISAPQLYRHQPQSNGLCA